MFQDDDSTLAPIGNPAHWCTQVSIPEYLMRWPQLCAGAKIVYCALAHLCHPSHSCCYSLAAIASASGLRRDQAQKHLKKLDRLGLISRKRQFNYKSVYTLRLHPILQGRYPGTDSSTTPSPSTCRTLVRTNLHGVNTDSSPYRRVTSFPAPKDASPESIRIAEMAAKLAFQRSLLVSPHPPADHE